MLNVFFIAAGLVFIMGGLWILSAYLSNNSFVTIGKNWLRPITLYLIFGFIAGIALGQFQDHQRKVNATKIIVAIDNYKKTTGSYPLKLEDFIPSYLYKIPSSHWGLMKLPYGYSADMNSFSISYQVIGSADKIYRSSTRNWLYID